MSSTCFSKSLHNGLVKQLIYHLFFVPEQNAFISYFLQMEVHNLILALLLEFNDQDKAKAPQPPTPVSFDVLYALTSMHQCIL